jgi:hypothetical protein
MRSIVAIGVRRIAITLILMRLLVKQGSHSTKDDNMSWDDDCEDDSWDEDEDLIDGVGFADPGGNSALRAETENNPRNLPCPTCGEENVLTPLDVKRGYQCDSCADAAEGNSWKE